MAFSWSSTHPTLVCRRGSCWLAVPSLPDANILSQCSKASLLACQPPTSGSGQRVRHPGGTSGFVSPASAASPPSLPQSVHTHCSFWALCSRSSIPWRPPWFIRSLTKYSGDEHSLLEMQISGRINTSQRSAYWSDVRQKSKAWVFRWKGAVVLTLYSLGLPFLFCTTRI